MPSLRVFALCALVPLLACARTSDSDCAVEFSDPCQHATVDISAVSPGVLRFEWNSGTAYRLFVVEYFEGSSGDTRQNLLWGVTGTFESAVEYGQTFPNDTVLVFEGPGPLESGREYALHVRARCPKMDTFVAP